MEEGRGCDARRGLEVVEMRGDRGGGSRHLEGDDCGDGGGNGMELRIGGGEPMRDGKGKGGAGSLAWVRRCSWWREMAGIRLHHGVLWMKGWLGGEGGAARMEAREKESIQKERRFKT